MECLLNKSKSVLAVCSFLMTFSLYGQSIQGTWQLVKQTSCLESEMSINESSSALVDNMKSMSSPTPQIVTFKDKGNGEESTRILNKKKGANNKNFLYKYTGETLLILDKKSQTLSETFSVDKLSTDSLIISNNGRACETKIFLKIKQPK